MTESDAAHAIDYVDQFNELVRRWRLATAVTSSVTEMVEDANFQQIIEIGKKAVPLIVREIRNSKDFLFMALSFILPHERVIPDSAKGKPLEMIDAWLRCGYQARHA